MHKTFHANSVVIQNLPLKSQKRHDLIFCGIFLPNYLGRTLLTKNELKYFMPIGEHTSRTSFGLAQGRQCSFASWGEVGGRQEGNSQENTKEAVPLMFSWNSIFQNV